MQVVSISSLLGAGLAALALTLLLAGPIKRLVVAIGWLDKPNFRKWHSGEVPLAGGLMIVLAVAILVVFTRLWNPPAWQLWAAGVMVFAIAFLDDRFPIRARFRLAVQIAAAVLVAVSAGWTLHSLGHTFGPFEVQLGWLALPFTILGMAALTNAVNMTDGLDGMAGGVVASALFWLMVAFALISIDLKANGAVPGALAREASATAHAAAMLIGATLGFLAFNQRLPWRRRASLFLGDGGSMMLGFTIAALCVHVADGYGEASAPAAAIGWIIAVPLIDLFSCILRRLRAGVTPMTPDRRHLHHLLVAMGLPVGKAVFVLQLVCLACGAIGIAGWRLQVAPHWMFWSLALLFVAYHQWSLAMWRRLEPTMDLTGRPKEEIGQDTRSTGAAMREASATTTSRAVQGESPSVAIDGVDRLAN